jgi:hypothetical protein
LSNKISDIEVFLVQVANYWRKVSRAHPDGGDGPQDSTTASRKAEAKLYELKAIIDTLAATSRRNNVIIFRAGLWRKERPRLQALQEDIKAIKLSLNVILGASNS